MISFKAKSQSTILDTIKKNEFLGYLSKNHNGEKYVPFEITTLDGKKINNESLVGKVTFINFWFEGCLGCRSEFQRLNELYDSLKTNSSFQFVSVTFDSLQTLPDFIKKFDLQFPIACIKDINEAWRMNLRFGFPTNIIVDKHGVIFMATMKKVADKNGLLFMSLHDVLFTMRSLLNQS